MAFSTFRAKKYTYDCGKDSWDQEFTRIRVDREPFGEGGMRLAYRAREILEDGSEVEAVVKRMKPGCAPSGDHMFHEAMTQMVAESYAQDFNKACVASGLPHRVAFLPVSVLQLEGSTECVALEPYLAGEYVKHNDNDGHNETQDAIAAAFSYFTNVTSNKLLVVCDIQGVGTFYTDPQVHTFDGEGFGAGNMGADGIQRFLASHRHSLLCDELGLPSLDAGLSDEEIARKLQASLEEEEEAALGESELASARIQSTWRSYRNRQEVLDLRRLLGGML